MIECESINTEIPVPRQFICQCFDSTSVHNMLTVVGFPSGYLYVQCLDLCIKKIQQNVLCSGQCCTDQRSLSLLLIPNVLLSGSILMFKD